MFTTKAEANRWLATVQADRARGLWVDPRAGRVKLEEYAVTWLDSKVGISPRTREIYGLQLRLHILPAVSDDVPALGPIPIADITPELVRAWYVGLTAKRGSSVAAKAYGALAGADPSDPVRGLPAAPDHRDAAVRGSAWA